MGLLARKSKASVGVGITTKDIDVAVQKATRGHLPEDPPKEKHVVALKMAVSSQGGYVVFSLLKRLHGAKDWVTALKASLVIHRLMKETEGTQFMDELCVVNTGGAGIPSISGEGQPHHKQKETSAKQKKRRVHPLNMDGFLDTKAVEGKYDFSEWVRAYCKFIDESLDAYYHSGWYADMEKSGKESSFRSMTSDDLLEYLPRIQRIQRRLVDCKPTGSACQNDNTLFALSLVVRDSFKIHKAISEGIINLADKFFQMDYYNGVKARELYSKALQEGDDLQKYYACLQQLDAVKRVIEFPKIEVPPADFLESMREHLEQLKEESGIPDKQANQPLRRGRERKLNFSPPDIGTAIGSMDPGMIIAPLSRQVSEVSEERAEELPPTNKEPKMKQEEPINLLDIGELDPVDEGMVDETPEEEPQQQLAQESSPLDLLSELDFSTLHVSQGGGQQPVEERVLTQNSTTNPIPDAFVMGAAGEMYGKAFAMPVSRKESTASVSSSHAMPQKSQNPFAD